MLIERRHVGQVIHRGVEVHSGLQNAPRRRPDPEKLHAKRLSCRTCDGKGCVGRCKFEKIA